MIFISKLNYTSWYIGSFVGYNFHPGVGEMNEIRNGLDFPEFFSQIRQTGFVTVLGGYRPIDCLEAWTGIVVYVDQRNISGFAIGAGYKVLSNLFSSVDII